MGSQCNRLLTKSFSVFCSTRLKDETWQQFCTCWSGLISVDSLPAGNCSSLNMDRMYELTSVWVASLAIYWRMELTCLILVYAALHVLMVCCFTERSLSKMKPRLRAIPEN